MEIRASRSKTLDLDKFIQDGIDITNRTVNIFSDIENENIGSIIMGLQIMVVQNKEKPINIYINSNGGDVYSGFALYNYIRSLKETPVHTHILGIAASIASIIYLAGDVKHMYEESTLMLHSISGGAVGKLFSDMNNEVDESKRLYSRMCEVYANKSNKDSSYWKSHLKHEDRYYSPNKALELHLVDVIVKG
jgi:ATP-dependent Clp endopeptidase proteolytic subunit ClpP